MDPTSTTDTINRFFVETPIFTISIGISAVIATLIYFLGFSDVIRKEIKRRRMKHRIDHLQNHYIVCGFGRVGQQIAKELAAEGELFVILERDEAKLKMAKEHNWAHIVGDVALDETLLQKARIEHAKSIIISVGTDADVIFIAISARALKSDIFIVARASSVEAGDKLNKIGVNRVALPYQIGGYHMATMALRPMVVDFLDLLIDNERDDLEMEELSIQESSFYDGKTLQEAELLNNNVSVLVIRRKNGKAVVNPEDSFKLNGGDRLVVMGAQKDLQGLMKEFEKKQPDTNDSKQKPGKGTKAGLGNEIKPSPFLDE